MRTKPGTHKNFNFRIPKTKRHKANRNRWFFFLMKSRLSAKIEDYPCRVLILGERWKRKLLKETAKKKSEK